MLYDKFVNAYYLFLISLENYISHSFWNAVPVLGTIIVADIFECLLDLNFKQSKLTRLNF